jgi:arylsulfatase
LSKKEDIDGPHAPHHRGFDQFYGTLDGTSDFFAPNQVQLNGQNMEHEWQDNPDYYYTDSITNYALKFLREADEGKPFYLYLSFNAAHWPLHAKPEDIAHYQGRYEMGWDRLRTQRHARMKELGVVDPDWKLSPRNEEVDAWEETENRDWQQRRMEVYAAQVTSMDKNIGRVIDAIKAAGKYDDTLIIYHHDNGGCHVEIPPDRTGTWTRNLTTDGKKTPIISGNLPAVMPGPQSSFQSYGYGWANAANTPFRYYKQYDHEGGTRSPLIVSWPDGLHPDLVGGLTAQLGHAIDIMPTFLEAAGVSLVDQKPMPLEGKSFLSTVTGDPSITVERGPLFWAHNKGWAVRNGDWKLVSKNKKTWELYNLIDDGTELNDVVAQHPEKVAAMVKLFEAWDARTNLRANNSR